MTEEIFNQPLSEHLTQGDARQIVEEFQSTHGWPKDFNDGQVLRELAAYAFEKGCLNR